jgi:hypothetical protein
MPLQSRPLPFDHPDWVFEHKYDGFRALAGIEHGRAQLISRNGNPFESFADLAKNIATCIPNTRLTVLDVKSCAWTRRASHCSTICYSSVVIHAPSRLTCWPCGGCWGGCQWIPGCDTSAELTETAPALFQRVCKLDLEGIVQEPEVRPLRQRARRQQMFQDSEARIFANGWAGKTLRA